MVRPDTGLQVSAYPVQGGGWWWLGAHGGAGVSTLQQAAGGQDASRVWPIPSQGGALQVVVVCRSTAHGLTMAQTAARQWASGALPWIDLLGLVVVADAPGSLPRPLRDLRHLVEGGYPRSWTVPWVDAWRLGEPSTTHQPRQLASMTRELASLTRTGIHHGR
ncbi:DUF6668 family protein [Streptomyces beijiangensis]|uniref:DUF6668 family protein n=1 Tax=Streptomyces beijiangensis TaxID=163361 RepID=UPI0031D38486